MATILFKVNANKPLITANLRSGSISGTIVDSILISTGGLTDQQFINVSDGTFYVEVIDDINKKYYTNAIPVVTPVTTVAPTTVAPTTVGPTTIAPTGTTTTISPTTTGPTTAAPTTTSDGFFYYNYQQRMCGIPCGAIIANGVLRSDAPLSIGMYYDNYHIGTSVPAQAYDIEIIGGTPSASCAC